MLLATSPCWLLPKKAICVFAVIRIVRLVRFIKKCKSFMKNANYYSQWGRLGTRGLLVVGLVFAGTLTLSQSILAQEKKDVAATLTVQKIAVTTDGKEQFLPADQAAPSEILLYTAVYTNRTDGAVKGLIATLPIPQGVEYLADTAKPAGAKASTDGVTFQTIPLKRKVKSADGTEREELVPTLEYRKLQWNVRELATDASFMASARAKILSPQNKPTQ